MEQNAGGAPILGGDFAKIYGSMILIKNSKRALYCRYYAVVQGIFTPTIEPAVEWVKVRTAENLKRKISKL